MGKRVLRKYEDVFELFQSYLDSYGQLHLEKEESELLDRYLEQVGDEEPYYFSRVFGPKLIPDTLDEFLGYFMVRKVHCSRELLRATGTVMKKLAGWLMDMGYIAPGEAADMAELAAAAETELPAADILSEALFPLANGVSAVDGEEELEGMFSVLKVEPGILHLQSELGEPVKLDVPEKISKLCKEGWTISLLLVKTKSGWRIAETGMVYPI